jgi:hypothetical protein
MYLLQSQIVYRESTNRIGFCDYHRRAADPSLTVATAFFDSLRSGTAFTTVAQAQPAHRKECQASSHLSYIRKQSRFKARNRESPNEGVFDSKPSPLVKTGRLILLVENKGWFATDRARLYGRLSSREALLSSTELIGVDWLPRRRSEDQVIGLWTRIVPARFRLQITKKSSHPTLQFDRPTASRTFR